MLIYFMHADVAELADALDSGSSGSNTVWVQVPSSAPRRRRLRSAAIAFYDGTRDLKEPRHRETVRWTVLTAADQGAQFAPRVKSRLPEKKHASACFFQ